MSDQQVPFFAQTVLLDSYVQVPPTLLRTATLEVVLNSS